MHWLNVEFPEVKQLRMDMLGTTEDGQRWVDFELMSTNDPTMPIRMAEYALVSLRRHGVFPEQYVLYVGSEKLRMKAELASPNFQFRYKLIDIRDVDETWLLDSPFDSDNILAILTKNKNRRETIRKILGKIATLEEAKQRDSLQKLLILAGLRKLSDEIREEVKHMPILDDIMDHDLLGPLIRKSRLEGKQEGRHEGRHEGELNLLRLQLNRRFGSIPSWADENLSRLTSAELEDLSLRMFDAKTIDELFKR